MAVPIFLEFLLKSFSAFLIGSLMVSGKELFEAFLKVGVLNFLAIALFPFVDFLDSMNYMRFGYAMLPSVLVFLNASFTYRSKRYLWVPLTLLSVSLMVIYGSRGTIVVLLLFLLFLFLFNKKINFIRKMLIVCTVGCISIFTIHYHVIERVIGYLYFNMGIKSYTLMKMMIMFDSGLAESSSGRDEIYEYLISMIKQNPIVGHGIGFTQVNLEFTAHNIILQILIESGLIGLFIWCIVFLFLLKEYTKIDSKEDNGLFKVITLIISIALGRLMVSSDMWLRPELWLGISMLLNSRIQKSKRYINEN